MVAAEGAATEAAAAAAAVVAAPGIPRVLQEGGWEADHLLQRPPWDGRGVRLAARGRCTQDAGALRAHSGRTQRALTHALRGRRR